MATDRTHNAIKWKTITAGTALIEPTPTAVFFGTAGDVVAVGEDGVSATFKVAAGSVAPIQPQKITSGPADMVALYNV